MIGRSVAFATLFVASACSGMSEAERQGQDEAEFVSGWRDADGPGESAIVWAAGPNSLQYVISCTQADKSLTVRAEAPAEFAGSAKATLLLGASPVEGTATYAGEPGGVPTATFKAPLTPGIIAAIAQARSSRLVVGDAFTEASEDETAPRAFQGLAQSCTAITGVK